MNNVKTCKVKWFSSKRGLGFIKREGNYDIAFLSEFSSYSDIQTGDIVGFDLRDECNGPQAINLKKIQD